MSEDTVLTELALLRNTVQTGFARIDHYFELQQAQHLDLRGDVQELRDEVRELRDEVQQLRADVQQLNRRVDRVEERLTGVEQRLTGLEHEFSSFRNWAAGEFADVRLELRRLRQDVVNRDDALRRDVDALGQRVDRLEQRLAEG